MMGKDQEKEREEGMSRGNEPEKGGSRRSQEEERRGAGDEEERAEDRFIYRPRACLSS